MQIFGTRRSCLSAAFTDAVEGVLHTRFPSTRCPTRRVPFSNHPRRQATKAFDVVGQLVRDLTPQRPKPQPAPRPQVRRGPPSDGGSDSDGSGSEDDSDDYDAGAKGRGGARKREVGKASTGAAKPAAGGSRKGAAKDKQEDKEAAAAARRKTAAATKKQEQQQSRRQRPAVESEEEAEEDGESEEEQMQWGRGKAPPAQAAAKPPKAAAAPEAPQGRAAFRSLANDSNAATGSQPPAAEKARATQAPSQPAYESRAAKEPLAAILQPRQVWMQSLPCFGVHDFAPPRCHTRLQTLLPHECHSAAGHRSVCMD